MDNEERFKKALLAKEMEDFEFFTEYNKDDHEADGDDMDVVMNIKAVKDIGDIGEDIGEDRLNRLNFVPKDEKPVEVKKNLNFLKLGKPDKYTPRLSQPKRVYVEEIKVAVEKPDMDVGCMRYYYPNLKDYLAYNLPRTKSPWIQNVDGVEVRGKEAYENPMYYKPGQIYDYVQARYVDYFTDQGLRSPFMYYEDNIEKTSNQICDSKEFILQPQQKFVGSHMSNMTDFPSLMLYHGLGSGKTPSAIVIGESNKGNPMGMNGEFIKRKGSEIPQDTCGVVRNGICVITLVVTTPTINQVLEEIRGSLENGVIKTCTGACVYAEAERQDDDDYVFMRQLYVGRVNKTTRQPESSDLKMLSEIDIKLSALEVTLAELQVDDEVSESEKERLNIQAEINKVTSDIKNLLIDKNARLQSVNAKVDRVYYIISHDKFLNSITKSNFGNYVASDYILSVPNSSKDIKGLPHPDCFHSDKAVLIIDEVQKITREGGVNYDRLYDILNIYARDKITGLPRMKVILLTATPIFDNPHEAALMHRFQRPRISFPAKKATHDEHFIDARDKDNCLLKNKLCYQYIYSGYLSKAEGTPEGFPFRRNHIILHEMSDEQLGGYLDALSYDVGKDISDYDLSAEEKNFFDKAYGNQLDDGQQGRYLWSRQLCNIYLPREDREYKHDDSDNEHSAEGEVERLISILRQKQKSEIMNYYARYSPKFHYILTKILESKTKDEGPIIVYCEWVWYGILAMTKVLQLLGWKFLNTYDVKNTQNDNIFGIWSDTALTHMGVKNSSIYTSNLQKVVNHSDNINGRLCKVIFITVTEGISIKRVSQLHVTTPWWNESRMEQIIGRGIRFCSHADVDASKKYVDVYYHCSVLNTFKDYPKVNKAVDEKISASIHRASKSNKNNSSNAKSTNYKDLARLTIEQKVYITSRRKTDINNQFEKAMKETAIDFQLNKFGNLIRFEEITNSHIKVKHKNKVEDPRSLATNERILYSRKENKYYHYDMDKDVISGLEMLKKINSTEKPVWPFLFGHITSKIDPNKAWDKYKMLKHINNKGETMLSFTTTENLESFNNHPDIRDKNFRELMKYAILEKGEDQYVWEYYDDQRIRFKLYGMLVGSFNMTRGTWSQELLEIFKNRMLDGQGEHAKVREEILRGRGKKVLTNELSSIADSFAKKSSNADNAAKFTELSIRLKHAAENLPQVKSLEDHQVKNLIKRLTGLFFVVSDSDVNKMKDELVVKYRKTREYLDTLSSAELKDIYEISKIKERRQKKG